MQKKSTSRVQGSWAAPVRRPQNPNISHNTSNSTWAGKQNSDQESHSYSFKAVSSTDLKSAPKLQTIRENGEHILGTTDNGISKLLLDSNFLEPSDADWMFETLLKEINWKQQKNLKYGSNEGRLTEWFSNYPYCYSGVVQQPNKHWHPLITALCDRLNEKYRLNFNSVLANYYRDGHDSVDWHTDGEPALGPCPQIASISFGDTRNFELRQIPKSEGALDFSPSQQFRVPLTNGSMLLMLGAMQLDWQHRVPREYHDRSARINLTFRRMFPDVR